MLLFDKVFQSPAAFKRDPAAALERAKKSKALLALTVTDKPALVVQDADAHGRFLERLEQLETLEGLRRSQADLKAVRVRPARAALETFGNPKHYKSMA